LSARRPRGRAQRGEICAARLAGALQFVRRMLERISGFQLASPWRVAMCVTAVAFLGGLTADVAHDAVAATVRWAAHQRAIVPPAHHHHGHATMASPLLAAQTPTAISVIDIAPGVPVAAYPSLIHFQPFERVLSVDEHPVYGAELEAGVLLARAASPGSYVDLVVGTLDHSRRVLLLVH
jgi:hypothetical protein